MSEKLARKFINIHIAIPEELYEIAYAWLSDFKFAGIEERMDEIVICFQSEDWNDEIRIELTDILSSIDENIKILKEELIQDKNWNEEWEKNITPIIVNERIGIVPTWKKDEIDSELKILIDPKMSFGTGHHATTRLVCKLMDGLIENDSFWIDAGTGTGVLAILAVKEGARQVLAFDNNPWSIENTIENVAINGCEAQIEVKEADINTIVLPEAQGIAANMYTHLLVPSFPKFYQSLIKSKGTLLVSGVLVYDEKDILVAAEKAGFKHISTLYEDEWIAVRFEAE